MHNAQAPSTQQFENKPLLEASLWSAPSLASFVPTVSQSNMSHPLLNATMEHVSIASQFGSFAEQCGSDHVCATVVDAVLMLLLFIGLAIVCDDYLCPAIEELCARLEVPDEAAGASFLAFGSAAPEIMINVAATHRQKVELSVSAIMGSAIIAYCFIPAACFLGVGHSFDLQIVPTLRDTAFYLVALAFLLHVVQDGEVELSESLAISSIFVFYMLAIWLPLRGRRGGGGGAIGGSDGGDEQSEIEMPEIDTSCGLAEEDADMEQGGAELLEGSAATSDAPTEVQDNREGSALASRPAPYRDDLDDGAAASAAGSADGDEDGDEDEEDCWTNNLLLDVASKPFRVLFTVTMPDPEKSPGCYPLTFAISLFYVSCMVSSWRGRAAPTRCVPRLTPAHSPSVRLVACDLVRASVHRCGRPVQNLARAPRACWRHVAGARCPGMLLLRGVCPRCVNTLTFCPLPPHCFHWSSMLLPRSRTQSRLCQWPATKCTTAPSQVRSAARF